MAEPDCVFCGLIERHEYDADGPTSATTLLTPLNPVVQGHLLIISRRHFIDFADAGPWAGYVMRDAAEVVAHGRQHPAHPDYNVITSIGPAATQTVPHFHVHLVPRFAGDGLMLPWTNQQKEQA